MKEKATISNIFYYLQGNYRYKLYYSKFAWLIRKHISEQITVRIDSMDRQCYNEGQCKECGCATTALQMCNKPCKGNCYPKMQNKTRWSLLKRNCLILEKDLMWSLENNKFKNFKINE